MCKMKVIKKSINITILTFKNEITQILYDKYLSI